MIGCYRLEGLPREWTLPEIIIAVWTLLLYIIEQKYTSCYDNFNGCAAHKDSCRQSLDFTQLAYKNVLRATE